MLYSAFSSLVGKFINRKDITSDQIDFFVNTALREFQLRQKLNFTRDLKQATYPSTAGVGIALSGSDGIDPQFRALDGDYAASFLDPVGNAVPLLGDTYVNVQRRIRWNNPPNSLQWPQVNISVLPISQQSLVYYTRIIAGVTKLFLFPEVADTPLNITYFKWIPEYSTTNGGSVEDWMMLYGNQVLLWGAIEVANRFVSEDAKVSIDMNSYEKAIDSVIRADSTIMEEGASLSLD